MSESSGVGSTEPPLACCPVLCPPHCARPDVEPSTATRSSKASRVARPHDVQYRVTARPGDEHLIHTASLRLASEPSLYPRASKTPLFAPGMSLLGRQSVAARAPQTPDDDVP